MKFKEKNNNYFRTSTHKLFEIDAFFVSSVAPFARNSKSFGERHDFWEIVYVDKNKLMVTTDTKGTFVLNEGEAVFHKPMEYHAHCGVSNDDSHTLIISFECHSPLMQHFEGLVVNINEENARLLSKIVKTVWFNGVSANTHLTLEHISKATLYLELFLLQTYNQLIYTKTEHGITRQHYDTIVNFLQHNIHNRLTIPQIAQQCHLGETNMKKIFHMYSNVGIMTFFNQLKITKAKLLLQQGMQIKAVSDTLSFSSQNYFTVFFKRETGMSPLQYQRKHNS